MVSFIALLMKDTKNTLNILKLSDCSLPFAVQIHTDATQDEGIQVENRGVCLEYMQVAC